MKLFEIDQQIDLLMSAIEAQDGEVSAEAAATLDALEMDRAAKLLDIGCAVLELESEARAVKEVADSLVARRRTLERKAEWLRKYIADRMENPLKDARCRLSWRKSTAVEIVDVSQVPDQYMRFPEPTPDKTAIRAALEFGDVPGARIVTNQNLQIG